MPKVIGLGEALIDLFAEPGVALREADTLYPVPGGAPANVAVRLAQLGVDVGLISKVGQDEFGVLLSNILEQAGVDTAHVESTPEAPTMLAVVATPSPTEQHFAIYHGAGALLQPETLPRDDIESASLFYCGSVTLASGSRDATLQAAQWAKDKGRLVLFDANLRPAIWPDLARAKRWTLAALETASIVKMNETELEFLTEETSPETGCKILFEMGVQLCCVSLGGRGAYFDNGSVRGSVPVAEVNVVDTTGSGDAFVAGLIYHLSQTTTPLAELDETALRGIIKFANASGGLAATAQGGMSVLPDLEQIQALAKTML